MEPPKPQFTDALKASNPGLTDEVIAKLEELNSLRFSIDPDAEPERIKQIDQERQALINQHMPNYREVYQRTHRAD
jgi:hypothetical protein